MTREVLEQARPATPPPDTGWDPPPPVAQPTTVQRLRDPLPSDAALSWLLTVLITAVAFVLRIVHLARPNRLVFDETYYAKDAYSLLKFGYERNWPESANASITSGHPDVMLKTAEFVVHPPVGKWLIAAGEAIFGMNSFGWRIGSLVFGCLLIAVLIRLVRRISRNTAIGCLAGVLITFDGLHFVMSRTALLDIFLAFFLVAAVACLAVDRDWFRARLARWIERSDRPDLNRAFGPAQLWRPWRLAAGICFGLALGTKWNALYVLAAFALLSLAWDVGARRLAGAGPRAWWAVLRDGVPAFGYLVVVSGLVYLGTWTGWLTTTGGYDRDWGAQHPEAVTTRLLGRPLASLLHFTKDVYAFHTGSYIDSQTHTYAANPWGWLILARPIGIDAVNGIKPGTDGCAGPDNCLRVISGIGTPALWWGAVFALVAAAILWIGARDWRFGIPVVGVLSAWLPWFQYTARPLFFFYAIAIIPFSVAAVAMALGLLVGPVGQTDPTRRRRLWGGVAAGVFVALVVANFAYIYPILTDQLLPYPSWLSRMWFRSWI